MSKLIIANWKSNKSQEAARSWCEHFLQTCLPAQQGVVIAPPLSLLEVVKKALAAAPSLQLGAQDVSPFAQGAYTGAVSADQLSDLGVTYVIVGHSERRRYFHETSEDVAQKVTQAIQAGLTPIICVDAPYIQEQLTKIGPAELEKSVVAYEPLASIGSGNRADVGSVSAVVAQIHAFSPTSGVLYGGSVDSESVNEYCIVTDGVLVGSASLDAHEFSRLVAAVY